MSNPAGNTAFNTPNQASRGEAILTLAVARRMLPLVRRIISDLLGSRAALARMQPEYDDLTRRRRSLSWAGRRRRYELQEEIAWDEETLQHALAELEVLGLA